MTSTSEDFSEKCRLCSSKKNLISLFCGKAKDKRDYLRKLIQDFVNITIEYDDVISTRVCIVCCIYIYNFYNFKELAKATESTLKLFTKKTSDKPNRSKKKVNIVPVKDVELPKYKDLQKILSDWLTTKYAGIKSSDHNQQGSNAEKKNLIEVGSLTDTLKLCSKYIQTETETADCMCKNVRNFRESYVQVDIVKKTKNKYTQCDNSRCNVSVQTHNLVEKNTMPVSTQCEPQPMKDTVTQCNLCCELKVVHKEKSVFMTALNLNHTDSVNDQPSDKSVEPSRKRRNLSNSKIPMKIFCGTHNKYFDEKSTQTDPHRSDSPSDLPKNVLKSSLLLSTFSKSIDDFKTVPLSIITDKCSGLNGIKKEQESPKDWLPSFCSANSDNLSVAPASTELLSPRSAALMKVGKKHQRVYICEMCDKVTYTIKEKTLHRRSHLHCSLCKRRFRSIILADSHRKECGKSAEMASEANCDKLDEAQVNGNLFVVLDKLDFNNNVWTLYPNAFYQLKSMLQE